VTFTIVNGLWFPLGDLWEPALVVLGLATLAWCYHCRNAPQFVVPLVALAGIVAFSSAYTPLMYGIATTSRPWVDATLARGDAWLGFSAPSAVHWVEQRPWLERSLWLAYFSAIPQTSLLIAWFGLRGERDPLDKFLVRFMLSALACLLVFAFAPAQGTCAFYGFDVPAHYQPILNHLDALRDGTRRLVTWRNAEGLITCPSFHTTWAVLLSLAFWRSRFWRWPILLLNGVMIAATVPVGMHYLVDVMSGAGIAIGAVALDRCLARWAESTLCRPSNHEAIRTVPCEASSRAA
jgi:membrane-associated phospholipid phosphatase